MSVKHCWTSAVFLILLGGGIASAQLPTDLTYLESRGQSPPEQPSYLKPTPPDPTPLPDGITPSTQTTSPTQTMNALDGYTISNLPGCLWPVGGNGPIGYDVYLRAGADYLIGSGSLKEALKTGWEVQGGGTSYFYNPDGSSAWTVGIGVAWIYNDGHNSQIFTPNTNTLPVSYKVRDMERTTAGASFGKDWFCYGPGFVHGSQGWNLSYGINGGARWGTAHVNLTPVTDLDGYARNQATYGEYFVGAHANLQVEMGEWMFFFGVSGEFSYTALNLLPGYNTDLYNLSFLVTTGIRF